jgi:hypothetical protein
VLARCRDHSVTCRQLLADVVDLLLQRPDGHLPLFDVSDGKGQRFNRVPRVLACDRIDRTFGLCALDTDLCPQLAQHFTDCQRLSFHGGFLSDCSPSSGFLSVSVAGAALPTPVVWTVINIRDRHRVTCTAMRRVCFHRFVLRGTLMPRTMASALCLVK